MCHFAIFVIFRSQNPVFGVFHPKIRSLGVFHPKTRFFGFLTAKSGFRGLFTLFYSVLHRIWEPVGLGYMLQALFSESSVSSRANYRYFDGFSCFSSFRHTFSEKSVSFCDFRVFREPCQMLLDPGLGKYNSVPCVFTSVSAKEKEMIKDYFKYYWG